MNIGAVIALLLTAFASFYRLLQPRRLAFIGGSQTSKRIPDAERKRTFIVMSTHMGPERWRKALRGWQELPITAKYADFIFTDGKCPACKKLYDTRALLKSYLDATQMIDKSLLHELLMKEAPDTIAKTFTVGPTSVLPEGAWMIRSNWGTVGSHAVVATTTAQLLDLYNKWKDHRSIIIASEYIIRPLLHRGYKFHLRIYIIAAVYGTTPAETRKAWMVNHGLLIPALKPYVAGDWANKDIHDTHGKNNPNIYQFPADVPELQYLQPIAADCLAKALAAVLPHVGRFKEAQNGFQLYGADIMFWDDKRPVLIEINGGPAIGENTEESLDDIMNGYLASVMTDIFEPMGNPASITHLLTLQN